MSLPWEQPGEVSLWLGNFESEEQLEKYLEIDYSGDDAVPSAFSLDFEIGDYDEDFQEAFRIERASKDLSVLLEGCSYDEILIPRYLEAFSDGIPCEMNTVILLYNFKYHGRAAEPVKSGHDIKYIGSSRYTEK